MRCTNFAFQLLLRVSSGACVLWVKAYPFVCPTCAFLDFFLKNSQAEVRSDMILWALLLPHRIQFHRINRKIAHVAKDGPSLAAALSASSGSGPLPNEAAVLLAVSEARDAACPLEVGKTT